mgnify:CR=1 FL=1
MGYVEDIANTTSTVPVTNPSLNAITDSPLNFSLPRPVMQRPYIPRPYYYTSTPIFNTPAPAVDNFTSPTSSETQHPTTHAPLRSKDPLRINLNCQIGSERPISGFSK